MIILIIMIAAGTIAAAIAISKNRNPIGWGILCFLLPVLTIIPIVLPRREKSKRDDGPTTARGAAAEY